MKQIEVEIAIDGAVVVKTTGYKGKSCQDATKQLEQALGVVTSDVKTAEYHQTASNQQQSKQ